MQGATLGVPEIRLLNGQIRVRTRDYRPTHGAVVPLTERECAVAAYLAGRPGQIVSGEELLRQVWGRGWGGGQEELGVVRNTVFKLRQKVEKQGAHPYHFLTENGQGYRFEPGVRGEGTAPGPQPAGGAFQSEMDVGFEREGWAARRLLEAPCSGGCTLVGAWKSGKSWLAARLMQGWDGPTARIDPARMLLRRRGQPEAVWEEVAMSVAVAVGLDEEQESKNLATGGSPLRNLERWLEKRVFPMVSGRVLVLVEDLDRMPASVIPGLLCLLTGVLQLFQSGGRGGLLLTSTAPFECLSRRSLGASLSLGGCVALCGLEEPAVTRLAGMYGVDATDEELRLLHRHVGGHPYLARLLLAEAVQEGGVTEGGRGETLSAALEARLGTARVELHQRRGAWGCRELGGLGGLGRLVGDLERACAADCLG